MNESDVPAHRCHLDAVHYAIATDFIAERMHRPTLSNSSFDAITIIEMQVDAKRIFDREQVSWLLYNNIIDQAKKSKPKSHGNYIQALKRAWEALIKNDHNNLKSSLFFLSDGRPSDQKRGITSEVINQYIVRKAVKINELKALQPL